MITLLGIAQGSASYLIRPATHMGELPAEGLDPAQDLAVLRRGWGDTYRITWDNGWFRATHIIGGQAVSADNATELRKLILKAERDPDKPTPNDRRTSS